MFGRTEDRGAEKKNTGRTANPALDLDDQN